MNYPPDPLKPKLVPVGIAGPYIGHKRTKTLELANEGKLKTVKSGRSRLFVVESLDAYIDSLIKKAS
jgi:hypothetical protein